MESKIDWIDALVIVIYFVLVLAVGIYTSYKSKKDSVSSYFLASRSMHWLPVGASLFASNIGSGHFIGLAGSGAASGIGIAVFELNAIFVLMILGWLFVPVYMSSGIYTMPEYLRERFGGQRIRMYLAVLSLLLYVFTKISADLYAGALFITNSIGNPDDEAWLYISILILLAIAALFTVAGGLTAVIWTDFVQTILMIIGAFILMGRAFYRAGGYEKMVDDYFYAMQANVSERHEHCAVPPSYAMHMIRSAKPGESDLPWTGVIFGAFVSSIWYWCTDQVIVQRTLASKNLTHAKAGCLLAGVLKFLPMWMLVLPGMAARVLYPDIVGCVENCDEVCASSCTDMAYIKLVLEELSSGLRGLMLAVMLAALMSSLTSIFNSASTIFTIDIWQKIRQKAWKKMDPQTIEMEQLIVSRLSVIVLIIVSILWVPIISNSQDTQLFVYIQNVTAFLAPPVCAVYILAMFWDRTTEPGAFWGLMVGLGIGLIRFIMEFAYVIPPCASDKEDPRPEFIKKVVGDVHFLHFALLLTAITFIVSMSVSIMTEPIPKECLYRLTWNTRYSTEVRKSIKKWRKEKWNEEEVEETPQTNVEFTSDLDNAPKWKQVLFKVCGSASKQEEMPPPVDPVQEAASAADVLVEDPQQKIIVDTCAILMLTGATFYFGFYA